MNSNIRSGLRELRLQACRLLARLLFTPDGVCPLCRRVLFFREGFFCPDCARRFHPVSGPVCPACGAPVSEAGRCCPDCLRQEARLCGGVVFFRRDPGFGRLIGEMREGRRPELAAAFGYEMGRMARRLLPEECPSVVPASAGDGVLVEGFLAGYFAGEVPGQAPASPGDALLVVSLEKDCAGALSFLSDPGMKVYCAALFDA